MKVIITVLATSFVAYLLHVYSVKTIRDDTAISINRIQAEFALNDIETYKKIESEIVSNCADIAEKQLVNLIDQKMMQLAEYVQHDGLSSKEIQGLIRQKDEALLQELKAYKIDWKKIYSVPSCMQSEKTD